MRRWMKDFGWGDEDRTFDRMQEVGVQDYLRNKLGLVVRPGPDYKIEDIVCQPSRLPQELCLGLQDLLGTEVLTGEKARVRFSGGKSTRDLLQRRSLQGNQLPDVILPVQAREQLPKILDFAVKHSLALIPFGGGTSVVGGLDPLRGAHKYSACLDLSALNRVLDFDSRSHLLEAETGIYGLDLEAYLNARGFTLGHFPQSFEYTTLGGWVAARSSGQNSIYYGAIAQLVNQLEIATPQGILTTKAVPNMACGPDLKQVLIGSEGAFGIITSCSLKISRLPAERVYRTYLFKDFGSAAEVARNLVQSELRPAMIRVSDADETESLLVLSASKGRNFWRQQFKSMGLRFLAKQGYDLGKMSSLLLGFEGSGDFVQFQQKHLQGLLAGAEYKDLGLKSGEKWLRDRFFLPYARDAFMDQGLLVDTFETVTTWTNWQEVYREVQSGIAKLCRRQGLRYLLFCHLSHLYANGTSLYFTFVSMPKLGAKPLAQWYEFKEAANKAVTAAGGVISHHHGVGTDHREFLGQAPLEKRVWQGVKSVLDPQGIMNPGKVLGV